MSNDRALFWICVLALMGLGLLVGQTMAVAVAAAAGICLVYEQTRHGQAVRRA